MSSGMLMSTGLIAGGSLAGIIIALLVVFEEFAKKLDFSWKVGDEATFHVPADRRLRRAGRDPARRRPRGSPARRCDVKSSLRIRPTPRPL